MWSMRDSLFGPVTEVLPITQTGIRVSQEAAINVVQLYLLLQLATNGLVLIAQNLCIHFARFPVKCYAIQSFFYT